MGELYLEHDLPEHCKNRDSGKAFWVYECSSVGDSKCTVNRWGCEIHRNDRSHPFTYTCDECY